VAKPNRFGYLEINREDGFSFRNDIHGKASF
jgi:hypothetical protein